MSARAFLGDWDLVARIVDTGGTIKPPVLPAEPQVFTFGGGPGGGPVIHIALAHVVPPAPRWPPPDGPLCPCTNADPAACAGRHEAHPVQPVGAPCACICHVMGEP